MESFDDQKLGFTARWVPAQSTVKSYIRSLVRDAQHAEDLLQEVALRAHENFDQYDSTRPFIGWVLGITRYQVLAYFKRVQSDRHQFNDALLDSIESTFAAIQPTLNAREEALRHCVEKLPDRTSAILSARYRDGMTAPQIAEHTGKTATQVNTTLYRIRKSLKECIEERLRAMGVTHG